MPPNLSPSITFWHRLEPRPRSNDLANALAARVRDPAWFLARQWQLGEFHGEDAASPAYVRVAGHTVALSGWAPGATTAARALGRPVEVAIAAEGASPNDLSLSLELGQTFDRLLADAGLAAYRPSFLTAYPTPAAAGSEDPASQRLRALVAARSIDGVALYLASQQPPVAGHPPPGVPADVPTAQQAAVGAVVAQLAGFVTASVGSISTADAPAWQPADLRHEARMFSGPPVSGGSNLAFAVTPASDGDVAWHALDVDTGAIIGLSPAAPVNVAFAAVPAPVRFRGMPNERFWDFEDGRVDFGGLRPDKRNLASLLLADFMLVNGNDWFVIPYDMPLGSVAQLSLTVVDVFGGSTAVARADATDPHWSMFSVSNPDGSPAQYLVLPASCASVVTDGDAIEDVRFLRDETASLAWGVEHATESSIGAAWLACDRLPTTDAPAPTSTASLVYRLQTSVPQNWFPFQPVKQTGGDEIALQRSSLLSLDGPPTVPVPLGRVLSPSSIAAGQPYRVRDPEIPREGTRVIRRYRRTRDAAGNTYVWVSRARSVGTGEGWSGLRFDLALPPSPAE